MKSRKKENIELGYKIICSIVNEEATVLDLGCGSGELMMLLRDQKRAKCQGIEILRDNIFKCVEKGLSVFQLDFDSGLSNYQSDAFDYVILNRSLQETVHVEHVLQEAMRVGKRVIIGFPNFAHIGARIQLFFKGRTPVTDSLPHLWYNTPNLHFLSIRDFEEYIAGRGIRVISRHYFTMRKRVVICPNLFATDAIYVIALENGGV